MSDQKKIIYLIELKKYDQALSLIDTLLSINPDESFYNYLGSVVYLAQGEFDLAKDCVFEAIEKDPEENEYQLHLATIYLDNNELNECSSLLDELGPLDESESAQKLEIEAFLYLKIEDFKNAETLAKDILNLNPTNSNALAILGFTRLVLGRHSDSTKYISRSLEIDPENEYARFVFIFNQLVQNKIAFSEERTLNFLSEDTNNQLYLEALRFVLLAKNPVSKLILRFRFFSVRHDQRIRFIYNILFRIMLLGVYFFYISGDFLFRYSAALLVAHLILTFPFKTVPLLQNMFLLTSKFRELVISRAEMLFSVGVVTLVLFGLTTIFISPEDQRCVVLGLSMIYFTGLPFDYFYGVQTKHKNTMLLFGGFAVCILIGLLVFNNTWVMLSYLMIIGFLIAYPIWKNKSSIRMI